MNAIYASKIYRGLSKDRQSHVKAAIDDPLNLELVTQLKSYLDEEYQEIAEPIEDVEPEIEVSDVDETATEETSEDVDFGGSSPSFSPSRSSAKSFGDRVDDIEDDLGDMPKGDTLEEMPEELPQESADDVNESTNVDKKPITASITDTIHEIKGMLNLSETTAGVVRVAIKGKELWVYYKDDISLNNVMYDAMDRINASGYTYLDFNRLARTDNAIVFDIDYLDTEDVIKPIDHEE